MTGAPIAPDVLLLDPANPHPVHELRRLLTEWWDAQNAKGTYVNRGKDFPCHMGRWLGPVLDAFRHVLTKNGLGIFYDPAGGGRDGSGCWRAYDVDTSTWPRTVDKAVIDLFAESWMALTGWNISEGFARDTVKNMSVTPDMICRDWDLPAQSHAYVTLAGDGTLILIDHQGGLVTRRATPDDRLTPERCPPIRSPWVPGATCPVADGVVSGILYRPDAVEQDALVETYWAAASQILLRGTRSRETRRAIVVWGEAFSGKSVLLKVLRAVVDGYPTAERASLVCQTSLEDFDTQFGLAKMPGRMLWLVDETTEGYAVKNVATFKQIVDDAPVTVNAKHQAQMIMNLGLVPLIATNSPPSWMDVSKGTSSRVLMVNTQGTFVPAAEFVPGTPGMQLLRPDDELFDDLVREGPGVLQKLARTACQMIKAGAMPVSQETLDASAHTFAEHDRTAEFVSQAIMQAPSVDHAVLNNNIMRAVRGMVYDTGGGREEALRQTTLAARKRVFNRIRLTFKSQTRTTRPVMPGEKPGDGQHGVWLTDQGKEWLAMAMRNDDNMRQDLAAYMPLAERANGPMANPKGSGKGSAKGSAGPLSNVVAMPAKGAKPREQGPL